jgi:hypothetical protein
MRVGDDLLQAAVYHGKDDIVKNLVMLGADINLPPRQIPPRTESSEDESITSYRQAPFAL